MNTAGTHTAARRDRMAAVARRLAVAVTVTALGGCASFSADSGFGAVETAAQQYHGKEVRWAQSASDQDAIDRVKGQVASIIQSEAKDPEWIAGNSFSHLAYGDLLDDHRFLPMSLVKKPRSSDSPITPRTFSSPPRRVSASRISA